MVVMPDGTVGCLYETNEGAWLRIRFARFTLGWLTDGKDKLEINERTPLPATGRAAAQ
jgi:hypothetical protein